MAEIIGYKGEKLDLLIRQGATFGPIVLTITNPDNTPVDLADMTFRGQVRKTFNSQTVGATLTCQVTNAPGGQVTISIAATQTAMLEAGIDEDAPESSHVWDLEALEDGGRVVPYLYGDVKVFREVTR